MAGHDGPHAGRLALITGAPPSARVEAVSRDRCPACGSSALPGEIPAREMMIGTREPFAYRECGACATLWLADPPADLGPFYPSTYYARVAAVHPAPGHAIRRMLTMARLRPVLFRRGGRIGSLAGRLVGDPPDLPMVRPLLPRFGIRSFSDRILDVGCGRVPARLCSLRQVGFRSLLGVDPFVERDLVHHGIRVLKRELEDVDGSFDVIMFHHSLEHVRDPLATLRAAIARLRPRGRILVRTPIAGSWFWERYGADWWELDPPRHLVILSHQGVHALADRLGLQVAQAFHDSSAAEIIGSEQIARDLATFEPGSWFVDPAASAYGPDHLERMAVDVARLNREGRAGRGGYLLRPSQPAAGATAIGPADAQATPRR